MEHSDIYKLNLKSLSEGTHSFDYQIEDAFFEGIAPTDIAGGEVDVQVTVSKISTTHTITLSIEGVVDVPCDRCLDLVDLDVESTREFVVKFGAEHSEEGEDIIIVPEREGVLDLKWLIYEEIVLALPLQRLHIDGECNESMLEKYNALLVDQVSEEADSTERDDEGIDQRWAALKKLRD